MSLIPLRPARDPFATLVSLTAAALSATPLPPPERRAARPSPGGTLLARLDRWLWTQRQRDLERSLATSTDAADVENRLRARERALLHRYY